MPSINNNYRQIGGSFCPRGRRPVGGLLSGRIAPVPARLGLNRFCGLCQGKGTSLPSTLYLMSSDPQIIASRC